MSVYKRNIRARSSGGKEEISAWELRLEIRERVRHLDPSISALVGERDEVRAVGVSVVARIILSPTSRLRKSESVGDCILLEERNF